MPRPRDEFGDGDPSIGTKFAKRGAEREAHAKSAD